MPDATIGDSLHRLLHAYKRALRQAYQEGDVSLAITHIRSLKSICSIEGCTAQAIAARTGFDKAQVTRAVNDLTAEGLVEKRENPEDRRSVLLTPTPDGRSLVRRIRRLETKAGQRMGQGLDPAELAEFVRLANHMAANLREG